MKVSAIIPYYNHGVMLHSAVQSILTSYDDELEIIIVNDGSLEKNAQLHLDMARRLSDRVTVITKRNGGLSSARNAGLAASSGDFVQFLDSDDILLPGKISLQIDHFVARNSLQVSICDYYDGDENLLVLRENNLIAPYKFSPESFLFLWERGFSVPIHAALFRRSIFDQVRFDESVAGKEDWILWSNIMYHWPDGLSYLPLRGVVYRQHGSGMNRRLDVMGDSWLRAAATIAALWSERHPNFMPASREWHTTFYRGARRQPPSLAGPSRENGPGAPATDAKAREDGGLELLLDHSPAEASSTPLISFIVSAFRIGTPLRQCINSILNQIFNRVELILIYGAPCGELEIRSNMKTLVLQNQKIKIFRTTHNPEVSRTRNLAVAAASGSYVAFVRGDDFIPKHAASTIATAITHSPSDYYFSDSVEIDYDDNELRRLVYGGHDWIKPSQNISKDLIMGMIASDFRVIRREVYNQLGGCRYEYADVQDWDLAFRIARHGSIHYIPEVLYYQRTRNRSVALQNRPGYVWSANRLRREAIEWLAAQGHDRVGGAGMPSPFVVTAFKSAQTCRTLLEYFASGHRVEFRAGKRTLEPAEVKLLREFNSFFDLIEVSPSVAAGLMGYLWSEKILVERI